MLFDKNTLTEFTNSQGMEEALRNVKMMNINGINDWYYFAILGKNEEVGHSEFERVTHRNPYSHMTDKQKQDMEGYRLQAITEIINICSDINPSYANKQIQRVMKGELDILLVVDKSPVGLSNPANFYKKKHLRILGFLIAELGECHNKPDVWSVNLICTTETKIGKRPAKLKSTFLLGAFLYCIKEYHCRLNPSSPKEGILELASGYENISGFVSYSKMGFIPDNTLYGSGCFQDVGNLPMISRLPEQDKEDIINATLGRMPLTVPDSTGILKNYVLFKLDPNAARKITELSNVIHLLSITGPSALNAYYYFKKNFNAYLDDVKHEKLDKWIEYFTEERDKMYRFLATEAALQTAPPPASPGYSLPSPPSSPLVHVPQLRPDSPGYSLPSPPSSPLVQTPPPPPRLRGVPQLLTLPEYSPQPDIFEYSPPPVQTLRVPHLQLPVQTPPPPRPSFSPVTLKLKVPVTLKKLKVPKLKKKGTRKMFPHQQQSPTTSIDGGTRKLYRKRSRSGVPFI